MSLLASTRTTITIFLSFCGFGQAVAAASPLYNSHKIQIQLCYREGQQRKQKRDVIYHFRRSYFTDHSHTVAANLKKAQRGEISNEKSLKTIGFVHSQKVVIESALRLIVVVQGISSRERHNHTKLYRLTRTYTANICRDFR